MEPFYFGEPGQRLYGAYHPPAVKVPGTCGTVLCYPVGQEYIRSHRAFLRLAELLSDRGIHVLRFDYFGCGDSDGAYEDASMKQWLGDIHRAIEELRSGSGVQEICLIGLRLGGFLALRAGAETVDVNRLVLWDPVVGGKGFLEETATSYERWLEGSFAGSRPRNNRKAVREAHGFPITDDLCRGIEDARLDDISQKPANRILIIDTQKVSDNERVKMHLESLGADVEHEHVPSFPAWTKRGDDMRNKGVVPANVLNDIVSWVTGD